MHFPVQAEKIKFTSSFNDKHHTIFLRKPLHNQWSSLVWDFLLGI